MAAIDLVSLEEVRQHRQYPADESGHDPEIAALITRWSRAIMAYCGREFAPTASATARTFEYDGTGLLDLAPYDIRTVSQVRKAVETDDPTTLTSSEYRLFPYPASRGVYTHLRLAANDTLTGSGWTSTLVEVTGDWGFSTVPEEAEQACIEMVILSLEPQLQAFGGTLQPNSLGDGVNDTAMLPPGVRGLLDPLVRRGGY